jgi:hypothetical protein
VVLGDVEGALELGVLDDEDDEEEGLDLVLLDDVDEVLLDDEDAADEERDVIRGEVVELLGERLGEVEGVRSEHVLEGEPLVLDDDLDEEEGLEDDDVVDLDDDDVVLLGDADEVLLDDDLVPVGDVGEAVLDDDVVVLDVDDVDNGVVLDDEEDEEGEVLGLELLNEDDDEDAGGLEGVHLEGVLQELEQLGGLEEGEDKQLDVGRLPGVVLGELGVEELLEELLDEEELLRGYLMLKMPK